MFSLIKWAYRRMTQSDTVEALEEKIRRIETQLQRIEQPDVNDYSQTTGRVTVVRHGFIVIDKKYVVQNDILRSCIGYENIKENTRLSYVVCHQLDERSGESTERVVKILSIIEEKGAAVQVAPDKTRLAVEKHTEPAAAGASETVDILGQVIDAKDNVITVETYAEDFISVDLHKTSMSFLPMLGDLVTLNCRDHEGEKLRVISIEPSHPVNGTGQITAVTPDGGTIRNFFTTYEYRSECLDDSYQPALGDKVKFQAIENALLETRFLSVELCVAEVANGGAGGTLQNAPNPTVGQHAQNGARKEGEERSEDKPISIVGEFEVLLQSLDETVERTIIVKNESKTHKRITKAVPVQGNSLVTLKSPASSSNFFLFPGETAQYVFSITGGSFLGRHRERWVWNFAGQLSVSRTFTITIGDVAGTALGQTDEESSRPVYHAKQIERQRKQAMLSVLRQQREGRVVPGPARCRRPNFVAHSLPLFIVPSALFNLVLEAPDRGKLNRALCQPPYSLDKPLSSNTYIHRFRNCIFLEEICQCIAFRQHDIEQGVFKREDTFLALDMPNVMEARPSLLVGNLINATAKESREGEQQPVVFQGVVHRVLSDKLLVKFDPSFYNSYKGEIYHLTFWHTRTSYRKMQHAVEKVKATLGMEFLLPETVVLRKPYLNVRLSDRDELELMDASRKQGGKLLPWHNPILNHNQKTAIVNVLRGEARPLPYVIFGPPGTGKTMTTVELIHQLVLHAPNCRLIVATPSNSAANLITEQLVRAGILTGGDLIRLMSANQVERDAIPKHLVPYCATVDIADHGTFSTTEALGQLKKYQAKDIQLHRVTVGTCSIVGMLMQLNFPRNHFTHVIIDEAGQSVEPETLIPLTQINRLCGSVTLVGDPQQLGPTVQSYEARNFGYHISLMERLLDTAYPYLVNRDRFPETHGYDPRLVTKLCLNYRATPSVLALYSDLFYDSQLVPLPENTAEDTELLTMLHGMLKVKRPTADYGFFFYGVDGVNKQTPDCPSWYNPLEAATVQGLVTDLYRNNYKPEEIGICTPYVKQVKLIASQFIPNSIVPPKIGSVEEFQGQERRIMIISTVRSSSAQLMYDKRAVIGFISEAKRINVSISRAKAALIVVGNPDLLACDATWLKVMRRAVDNGTFVGCALKESVLAAIQTGTPVKPLAYTQKSRDTAAI